MSSRLVVKPHRPYRALAIRGLVAVAFVSTAALMYEFGRLQGGYHHTAAVREKQALEARVVELAQRNAVLRDEVASLRTSRDIDREAYHQVEQSVAELQAQILEQRKELAFYRGIVSPADGAAGLRVQALDVAERPGNFRYRVRLVLVQALRHDRAVEGSVRFSVEGAENGNSARYEMSDLSPDGTEALEFSFRYFQDLEQELVLPENFEPERIDVEIRTSGSAAENVQQTFDWSTGRVSPNGTYLRPKPALGRFRPHLRGVLWRK